MAKIKLPPAKNPKEAPTPEISKVDEKKILNVINKGGSTTKKAELDTVPPEEVIKNFNIKLLESELNIINDLRKKRPKARGQSRLGISLQGWMEEAIQEKIEKEKKKYKI
ncbi:P-loop NTPase family protein [Adhaeribacter pallidiroseus]|uniref:Uncharacterized protein n=1 Tax=Adhaeribacter pallidiroseus TaxID=2072847 RepID=A0A369Q5K2_9BACT|nr:hypothetical protein [Adhaeribacter pallidiroseus]RDC58785.1 hypothetical protein AHMF7616_05219 [Adhaeribacter pallidiroseus]